MIKDRQKNALISVFDKTGILEFANELVRLNVKIYASGGTAKKLSLGGVPVIDVAELVGGDAILGHRVVTLSREIHAGLLARPEVAADMKELKKLGIPFFDLVYCNMYPLEEEIAKKEATLESIIEQTDIGGPTMLRSAAKGRRIVLCDKEDTGKALEYIKKGKEDIEFIQYLVAKAEFMVSSYIFASAKYHSGDKYFAVFAEKFSDCLYGENGYQSAGIFKTDIDDPLAVNKFKSCAGMPLSANNMCDLDRLLNTITHIAAGYVANFPGKEMPKIAIAVKHGNPCGASYGHDVKQVLRNMLIGDTRAIFGGLVITNFEIGKEYAEIILNHESGAHRRLLDGIIAPSFSKEGFEILEKRAKCRLVVNEALGTDVIAELDKKDRFRYIRGGVIAQSNYDYVIKIDESTKVTGSLDLLEKTSMILAWAIGCTSTSNTITLVQNNYLIGNGVGQQDRVGCCELAVKRANDANHEIKGAIAYSDSFFPFKDGPEVLIEQGISAIFTSSGSVKDDEIVSCFKEAEVTLYMVPDKECRGFFGH